MCFEHLLGDDQSPRVSEATKLVPALKKLPGHWENTRRAPIPEGDPSQALTSWSQGDPEPVSGLLSVVPVCVALLLSVPRHRHPEGFSVFLAGI